MDAKQLAVYEEFARNIPGFLPSNDLSQPTGFLAQPMKVNEQYRVNSSTASTAIYQEPFQGRSAKCCLGLVLTAAGVGHRRRCPDL